MNALLKHQILNLAVAADEEGLTAYAVVLTAALAELERLSLSVEIVGAQQAMYPGQNSALTRDVVTQVIPFSDNGVQSFTNQAADPSLQTYAADGRTGGKQYFEGVTEEPKPAKLHPVHGERTDDLGESND